MQDEPSHESQLAGHSVIQTTEYDKVIQQLFGISHTFMLKRRTD